MSAPIFASVDGAPLPLLPRNALGVERKPDGASVLSLEQAAERFKLPGDVLRKLYLANLTEHAEAGGRPLSDDPDEAERLRELHRKAYPQLKPVEFAGLVDFARRLGLDPFKKHVYPQIRTVNGRVGYEWRLRLSGMKVVVRATGDHIEVCGPLYTYTEERYPLRCTMTGTRTSRSGQKYTLTVSAAWAEHARPTEWYDRSPETMLAKCCEAKLLRGLFPDELGDVYAEEEGATLDLPTGGALPPAQDTDPQRRRPWPKTSMEFHQALHDCQLREAPKRKALIVQFRQDLGDRLGDEEFYRAVLERVYADPARYGARLPEAEAEAG